ncbi:ASCH domain-containing protein [uncultured Jatrophihabitans sp.]|uniref:ASCH domain-containing protein n=1 Tax=uncultured Jatrophihabitans sp. TaxID=1610747 RepID=UPI0035CC261F
MCDATLGFGYDGDGGLGDRLVAAVVRGDKTATSSLAIEYLSGEPLPRVGQFLTLVDGDGRAHGTVRTTGVTITPLHLVGDDVAFAEGEGYADAAAWRRGHKAFWRDITDLVRADAGDPTWQLRDSEPVVVHHFELVGVLRAAD